MKIAESGNKVRVHYTGKLEDGSVFDSSVGREPLEFVLGQGQLIPGFEKAVLGKCVGDKTVATLVPDEAYGETSEELFYEIPMGKVPEDIQPVVGMQLSVSSPEGSQVPVTVTQVTEQFIVLDANHPLAGKTLIFDIEIMEVI